jgi:hypothetical protein
MSFETGIALNYVDLANRLRKFITGIKQVDSTSYLGTGNGTISTVTLGASAVTETFTLTCTVAALNGGTFSVVGSVTGALANATVGTPYTSAYINFTINDGTTDYAVGDAYTVVVYASTMASPWAQMAWTPGDVDTGGMSLYLRGPGAAADKQVYVNLRSDYDDAANIHNWAVTGAVGYTSGLAWGQQLGESPNVYLTLWKGGTIPYWIYANERRFILIAKINTLYISMHAGFFLPWATPAQYPFPLLIAASRGISESYTSTDSAFRMFCDPGGSSNATGALVRHWDSTWEYLINHALGTANDSPTGADAGDTGFIHPFSCRNGNATAQAVSMYYWSVTGYPGSSDGGVIDHLEATAQGERLLLPAYAMRAAEPAGYGAIDGVYFPCGRDLTPEQVATYGARNFRAFSNIFRTSSNDFFMVEEN